MAGFFFRPGLRAATGGNIVVGVVCALFDPHARLH